MQTLWRNGVTNFERRRRYEALGGQYRTCLSFLACFCAEEIEVLFIYFWLFKNLHRCCEKCWSMKYLPTIHLKIACCKGRADQAKWLYSGQHSGFQGLGLRQNSPKGTAMPQAGDTLHVYHGLVEAYCLHSWTYWPR